MRAVSRKPAHEAPPGIIDRIYESVEDMPKAMARIALYVSQNPDQVIKQTIVQLGENTGSGQATIIRLCKALGYDGFKELKIALAAELARERAYRERTYKAMGRSTGHGGLDALNAALQSAIQRTAELLDPHQIEQIANRMRACRRIDVYGSGVSGICAEILTFRLLRLGLPAALSHSSGVAREVAGALGPHDVAIGISFSGVTEETLAFLKAGRTAGAHTIAVTTRENSKLARLADEAVMVSRAGPWPMEGSVRLIPSVTVLTELLAGFLQHRDAG